MNEEPIHYGIVGLGRSGWSIHVEALRCRADAKIVAVVDPLAERRAEAERELGCSSYASLGRMLKRQDDLEVVVVATPSARHAPDSKAALRVGRHVVVEKPLALSVAQADGVIRTAEQAGRLLCVHQNYRFTPIFAHLREVADSGIIGRVFHIRNTIAAFARRNDWQTLSQHGGGVLNNTCSHYLDIILQLIGGPIVRVLGDLQQVASAGDVEDHVKAFLVAANGCTADIEVSNAQNIDAAIPRWILCGTCGTLTSNGTASTIRFFDPALAPPLNVINGAVEGRTYGNDDVLPWQEKKVDAVGPVPETFYDNVTAAVRRGEPLVVTPGSVREVLRVMALIRKGK